MLRPLAAAVICLAPGFAYAASVAGNWRMPMGTVQVTETGDGVIGKLTEPAADCPALQKGAEVMHGSLLDGTFSGELRLCLDGPQCTAKESWLSALLMANGTNTQLSGAVERGNDACHAKAPGKGGVTLRKIVPGAPAHADARAKVSPATLARVQELLGDGQKQLEVGQPEQARKLFEKAAALAPVPEAYNGIGVTHYMRNEYPDAIRAYQKAVETDPDFGDAYYNMACIHAVTGRKDLAFKFLQLSAKNKFHDFSAMDDDQDLASLRADPRYAALKKAAGVDSH
ncbi:MAG: tetratricopeptide repeat protein [Deltaproteobacteria bacterium]|nr:tetratricopeptide repeat protein [Deltaproteobacteria bacterium]